MPVFKLVKENESRIVVYQGNNEIGFVSNDLTQKELVHNSNASELTHIPKISYAQLLFFDNCPDNHDFPRLVSAELIDELKLQQEKILNKYFKEQLITIAGTFFHNPIKLTPEMELKLVKEPDNIHDADAIAVYFNDSKIGYVANSYSTNCKFTTAASKLKNISNISYAKYLMHYDGRYHIARILD